MTVGLKLTQIGDSIGVIIPKEILEQWHSVEGDTVYVTGEKVEPETDSKEAKIRRQMEVAERVMRENRNLLHRLAQ